ncbi:PUA-like domain-containing protein [Hypoxylon cercidicola]|nr:PUA-like domain-containing protein [Hypoxylon cercidicola]
METNYRLSMFERIARYNQSPRSRLDIPQLHIKAKRISDGGGDHSLFSRQREFMNQILSPMVGHFGYDGAASMSSKNTGRLTTNGNILVRSIETLPPSISEKPDWDREALLRLSDSVRASLCCNKTLGPDAAELSDFLDAAWRYEDQRRHPSVDFEVIEYARLDKLLAEVLDFAEISKAGPNRLTTADAPPLRFRVDVLNAKSLSRNWRRRFRDQYFMIDQHRREALVTGGRLTDASFDDPLTYSRNTETNDPISELEGNLQFEAGDWWLNIACAWHDGIVASTSETPTKGRYGITALPLLTGQEDIINSNTFKYIREGKPRDMHIPLISQVGRQIRILRGYQLKSLLAPEAGVRYDGLFTIKQYGSKLGEKTGVYRLELLLERVPGQKKSLDEVRQVPRPSQLDDWNSFTKLEGDRIKVLHGEATYLWWVIKLHEEKAEREEWKRAQLFRASCSQ